MIDGTVKNVRVILMNYREEKYGTVCIVNSGIWDNHMLSGYANKTKILNAFANVK